MSALLASDRVSALKWHAAVAIAAEVVDSRSLSRGRVSGVAGLDGDGSGGRDISFAVGHLAWLCGGWVWRAGLGYAVGRVGEAEKCEAARFGAEYLEVGGRRWQNFGMCNTVARDCYVHGDGLVFEYSELLLFNSY